MREERDEEDRGRGTKVGVRIGFQQLPESLEGFSGILGAKERDEELVMRSGTRMKGNK